MNLFLSISQLSRNDTMATNLTLMEKLYNFDYKGKPLTQEEIQREFGDIAAIYATDNGTYFAKQLKYNKFFFGPYAKCIKCVGTSMPLITQQNEEAIGIQIQDDERVAKSGRKYFADLFAHDPSIFTVARATVDDDSEFANARIASLFAALKYSLPQKPTNGSRAFITRAEFLARVDMLLRKTTGEPDKALAAVWNGAGNLDTSAANQSYEFAGSNYCIAGGSISKLLDPCIQKDDLCETDVDIFVFGDIINQRATIERLIAMLFEPGKTYITIRGGVVNIRRVDCIDVQIVSTQHANPMSIIGGFDIANVMCYWFAGTVFANAACVHAFRTRVVRYGGTYKVLNVRIIKIIKSGFTIRLSHKHREKLEQHMHSDGVSGGQKSFRETLILNLTRLHITSAMKDYEILANISRADDFAHEIITENPSSGGPISERMIVGNAIDNYSCSMIQPDHFNMVVLKDVKTVMPRSRIFTYVAGFRARISCRVAGVLNHDRRTIRVLFDEDTTRAIVKVVAILDAKMIAEGKLPLNTRNAVNSVAAGKMDARVMISDPTRVEQLIDGTRKKLMVGFTIYCESSDTFHLELTYI